MAGGNEETVGQKIVQTNGLENVAIEALNAELGQQTNKAVVIEMPVPNNAKKKSNSELIQSANNKVLIDVLSPQVEENEKAKRVHKYILIGILGAFIVTQFFMTFFIMNKTFGFIFGYYNKNNKIDQHLVNLLFTFLTGYITSVVVELIYMLKFIVQNVFDTSISDLVKLFKEETKK